LENSHELEICSINRRNALKLAVVGKVIETAEIEGADFIQQAYVDCADAGKWSGVVSKEMAVGEGVIVFLQDAVLPPDSRWAFMERHKWRVRMARFKGVPSECVIIGGAPDALPGSDMTEALGVTKYEKPVSASMAGEMAGAFPSFLPKTDEPNFQTVDFSALMASKPFYVTEKADGTSCTAWVDEDGLHVASRNWELREKTSSGVENVYWRSARKYDLAQMPVGRAVQFEVVGVGVQANPMGLTTLEARMFGQFTRDGQGRWLRDGAGDFDTSLMPQAKEVGCYPGPMTADELRALAAIKYANGKHGEGVVIRAADQSWSFKVINLLYKD
jgi:RNA ligase (TIGR02306 family)